MCAVETNNNSSTLLSKIAVGKDAITLLRDVTLLSLAVLLVAFPTTFNSILVDAGFEEGSVVGFKWKSKLVEANKALQEAQRAIAGLQSKNDELLKALSEADTKSRDPKLLERLSKLEEENKALKTTSQNAQARVTESIAANAPLVEKASRSSASRTKADFLVGLQTLGVEDSERKALNEKLRAEGYSLDPVTWSYPANQRPSWFANQSTVFYYSESARPMAAQVAEFMKSKTGQNFLLQRGSGLGVDPSQKDVTLFVHYLKGR